MTSSLAATAPHILIDAFCVTKGTSVALPKWFPRVGNVNQLATGGGRDSSRIRAQLAVISGR